MMIPALAPSTPASHEPCLETGLPFSYSVVSSPRYQTLPFGVLGVLVERVLDDRAVLGRAVVHDARGHAGGDAASCVRDRDDDALARAWSSVSR